MGIPNANMFVRISIDDIQPGIVLERDLYSSQGALLAPAGTLLTEEKYKTLLRIGIHVLDYGKLSDNAIGSIPSKKQAEFNTFLQSYEIREREVSKYLQQIGNGEEIDVKKTFELTDNVISRLKNKNDVFLYLHFIKDFDNHTFSHCSNVALLCNVFGSWMGFSDKQITEITITGLLHDVGKMGIPLEVLNKSGKLTPKEFNLVQNHSVIGYNLIKHQPIPDSIKQAVLLHHEKMDGSGYPFGLKGSEISTYAKIVSICDIYDAMTSARSYHKKRCPFDVIATFETGLYGEMDTELLFKFLNNIAFVYLNSTVILSDGLEAEVIFISEKKPSRPMVKTEDGTILDLTEHPELMISRIK